MSTDRYQKTVQKIFALQFFGIKLGLVNIRRLLDDVHNPERTFQVVLVAGTNGKGSVASTLSCIVREAGLTCGLFTSPHLIRFNERFAVNGRQISDQQVLDLSDQLWKHVDRHHQTDDPDGPSPITFFEFATAMACMHFRNENCDLGVFECGLGGRLDATNALEPILTIFTPISRDHMQYLGDTLTEIANEKAGILRPGVAAVVSHQEPEALNALEANFVRLSIPAIVMDRDYGIRRNSDRAVFWDEAGKLSPVTTALPGAYQLGNTSVAIAAARVLQRRGLPITDEAIIEGPKKVFWPGRLEQVAQNPTIILDGAHNEAAAKLLAKTLTESKTDGPTIGVLSIMADKEIEPILEGFGPAFDKVIATRAKMPRALSSEDLAQKIRKYNPAVETAPDLPSALEKAKEQAGKNGRVVICGSLFLVGEARAFILGEKGQGKNGEWIGLRG